MEQLPWILGILAALLHGVGYILYNMQSKKGTSKPNIVSWSIWAFMAGLNLLSFAEVTSFAHALQYVVGTLAAIVTFVLALLWGRFDWPSKREAAIFVICLISVGVWQSFDSASAANLIFLVALLVSFYPTFMGVYKDPTKEKATSWIVWTTAFAVNLLNNILSWNGDPVSVINPIILLVLHASIWILSRKVRQRAYAS